MPYHAPVDSGNNPGNPLRSYRMGMLAHGFVCDEERQEWSPDESGPMNYALVTSKRGVTAFEVTVVVMIALAVLGAILFG